MNEGLVDKAKALLLLKDSLGAFYETQKQTVVVAEVMKLPLGEAAQTLAKLTEIGFLTGAELAACTTTMMTGGALTATPKVEPKKEEPKKEEPKKDAAPVEKPTPGITGDTAVKDVVDKVHAALKTDAAIGDVRDLVEYAQNTLEVTTIAQFLALDEKDSQFDVLTDLLDEERHELFSSIAVQLLEFMPQIKAAREAKEKKVVASRADAGKRDAAKKSLATRIYNIWGEEAKILFIPRKDAIEFFCSADVEEDAAKGNAGSEHILFYLDISASMNHDEKGVYLAPKSIDHPASSIAKARDLIPPIAMAALKRHASVSVVVWNSKVYPGITFTPEEFYADKEDEEDEENEGDGNDDLFIPDDEMEKILRAKTGVNIFRATSGTNFEAAFKDINKQIADLSRKVKNIVVWFLTDGEETRYLTKTGGVDRIPTSRIHPKFKYFNEEKQGGLTLYQQDLAKGMDLGDAVGDNRCTIEFHVCHFGDAHPLFLKAIREAVQGHFHAVADIAKLKEEMTAQATGSNTKLEIIVDDKTVHKAPASIVSSSFYSRGQVQQDFVLAILNNKAVSLRLSGKELVKCVNVGSYDFPKYLRDGVEEILSLEPELGDVISTLSDKITPGKLIQASNKLSSIRKKRMEAILNIAKTVRGRHAVLQDFLEQVLESVENQIGALERMLDMYSKPLAENFDKAAAAGEDFFSAKERMAIAAGLDSMQVHLGHGFVAKKNLDRRVQRLVAQFGPWARKMLNRKCLLGQTEIDDENTKLTLVILDGHTRKRAQVAYVKQLAASKTLADDVRSVIDNLSDDAEVEFEESVAHDMDDDSHPLISTIVATVGIGPGKVETFEGTIPTLKLYPAVVQEYSVIVDSDVLDAATQRFLDPLSYSSFIDLISEANTLPAYLYTLAPAQSVGLIYNAKELLHVLHGGKDATSFGYFRLFWRLAEKEGENQVVQVPGTFSKANCALPIAPEPLTGYVLANLMPGLISEFITGTPMAPLTGIGDIYIGYLRMHMKQKKHTGMDIERMGEILSSLACWVNNEKTLPKPPDFKEYMQRCVNNGGVSKSDASGKNLPEKAIAYFLVDNEYPAWVKLNNVLSVESWRRYFVLLLGKTKGTPARGISEKVLAAQLWKREWMRELFLKLSGDSLKIDGKDVDKPVKYMDFVEQLRELMKLGKIKGHYSTTLKEEEEEEEEGDSGTTKPADIKRIGDEVIKFFKQDGVLGGAAEAIHSILVTLVSEIYGMGAKWFMVQRTFYVWYALASYPIDALTECFRKFEKPVKFEAHVAEKLSVLAGLDEKKAFDNTLFGWIEPESGEYKLAQYNPTKKSIHIVSTATGEVSEAIDPNDPKTHAFLVNHLWSHLRVVLEIWHWKGRRTNGFGTLEIDYAVVEALKDKTGSKANDLSQGQLSEYNAAKEYRNAKYFPFMPPKPVEVKLNSDNHVIAKQGAVYGSGKPRLTMCVIGNVDAGKSTTTGHLIAKCGGIDERTLKRLEEGARSIGKESFKYAWVMDRGKAERERGLTIDTTFWNIQTPNRDIDVIDSPGHRSFVKNMGVGASLADAALLIISAAAGEFEMGMAKQGMTREESLIAYTQGVKQFVVAINKMDHESVKFSQARFEEVKKEMERYLKAIGIPDRSVVVVPISGYYGDNLIDKSDRLAWYKGWTMKGKKGQEPKTGTTLFEALDAVTVPARAVDLPLRVTILKAHKIGGIGTVAIGRVACGQLESGTSVVLYPGGITTEVRSVELNNVNKKVGLPGDVIGFACKGVQVDSITRGMVASAVDAPVRVVKSFSAQIIILSHPNGIRVGYTPFFFCHTSTFPGRFIKLDKMLDKRTGKLIEENPQMLRPGTAAIVTIEPRKDVCLEAFRDCPPLGRFVIRDGGYTVAVGVVKTVEYYNTKTGAASANKKKGNKSKFFSGRNLQYRYK